MNVVLPAVAAAAVDMALRLDNAPALSKRSAISTAKPPSVPLTPARQTAIGVRSANA